MNRVDNQIFTIRFNENDFFHIQNDDFLLALNTDFGSRKTTGDGQCPFLQVGLFFIYFLECLNQALFMKRFGNLVANI